MAIDLGMMRAGWLGGSAAWVGFTLPSALLLTIVAAALGINPEWMNSSLVQGVKIAAVALMSQAVLALAMRTEWTAAAKR